MDEMNKSEGFHEQDTGLEGDFEGNLDNDDENSQDLSDDEEEGSIQNIRHTTVIPRQNPSHLPSFTTILCH